MKRVVIPEKSKLLLELKSNDSQDIIFKISAEKKAQLEAIVSNKGTRVVRTLREWMEKDLTFTKKVAVSE